MLALVFEVKVWLMFNNWKALQTQIRYIKNNSNSKISGTTENEAVTDFPKLQCVLLFVDEMC